MNRIRYYREKAGLSARQLADLIGVNPVYLRQVETGRFPAPPKLVARVAGVLGVSIQDLIGKE